MIPSVSKAPRQPLVDTVATAISDHIRKELSKSSAETWLPAERELAKRFGVSRPVIREATLRLELQGLIEIQHGKGLKIINQPHLPLNKSLENTIPDSEERLQQLLDTRLIIEPEISRIAAARATATDIQQLQSCQQRLIDFATLTEAAQADADFHEKLALTAGNHIFVLLLNSLADLGQEMRIRAMTATSVQKAYDGHAAVLTAIETHNGELAFKAMRHHMEEAVHDLSPRHA